MSAKIKNSLRSSGHHKYKPKGVSSKAFERVHWPYLPVLLIAGLLLSLGGQSGALQAAMRHPGSKVLAYSTSMSVSGLLSESNSQRANNSVGALALNGQLNAAAQAKANDMATRNYWSHNTPEGSPPWIFVDAQGYAYQKLGENLAAGFSSEQSTVAGWMASQPHKENLLDPAFSNVGFGFANNDNYTSAGGGPMTIVVAFYGKPRSSPAPPPPPAASTPPAAPVSKPPTTPQPTPPAPPAESQPTAEPAPETAQPAGSETPTPKTESKDKPATTDTPTSGITLSLRTSRAQVAFAHLPAASLATGLASFVAFAALGLWVSKHALAARRAFSKSEAFAIRHPLIDIGLITIAACAYLLTQTAGLIQ